MIKLTNLTKKYGDQIVLDNINARFLNGHIYGLVGKNGAGKTTLLHCICGFSRPSIGSIEVNGCKIGDTCDFPKETGIILDVPSFIPHYSGLKNLLILSEISHKISKDQVIIAMERVGLDPANNKKVRKYSLGMRQRLALAQAIMEYPKNLILDEPFNGLDRSGESMLHALLQEEKNKGCTIILASHNFADIFQACDEVYELTDGKLVSKTASLVVD